MKKLLKFQQRVYDWTTKVFGYDVAHNVRERGFRFTEEALELAQAVGVTRDEAATLVDYVFNRPVGDVRQEIGGVMVTLAALANVYGHEDGEEESPCIDIGFHAKAELKRIEQPEVMQKIREKQATKPKADGPLPGSSEPKIDPNDDPFYTDRQLKISLSAKPAVKHAAKHLVKTEALLQKHGVCVDCGELFSHEISAPFASCACKCSEWHELTEHMKLEEHCFKLTKTLEDLQKQPTQQEPIASVEEYTRARHDDEGYLVSMWTSKRLSVDVTTLPVGPLYAKPVPPVVLDRQLRSLLSDVLTAADLVRTGHRSQALAERLRKQVGSLIEADRCPSHESEQPGNPQVVGVGMSDFIPADLLLEPDLTEADVAEWRAKNHKTSPTCYCAECDMIRDARANGKEGA